MNKSIPIEVPVLLIGFNRPEVIKQSLARLRECKPKNMYFAVDAPREGREGEEELVNQTKAILKNIDWECKAHYKFNETNKGCAVNVPESINWVLEENDYVIIIEDDIITSYAFLKFAQDMLIKYKEVDNIYMVSSDQYSPMKFKDNADYTFSMYGHIWGWATWKRAFTPHFDLYVNDFDEVISKVDSGDYPEAIGNQVKRLALKLKKNGIGKTMWDYVWSYIKARDMALSIVPRVHLSSNIGVEGVDTYMKTNAHFRPFSEDFEVVNHPKKVKWDEEYDEFHWRTYLKGPSIFVKAVRKIKITLRK